MMNSIRNVAILRAPRSLWYVQHQPILGANRTKYDPGLQYYIGSMSEYISVPWHQVVVLPESINLLTGAAALLQGLTALTFVTEAHDVKKGETVLIHTVAGGLGTVLRKTRDT